MRRIHKVIAICGSTALVALTLTPAALAAGTASGGVGGAAGRAITLPNSNIKGSPPHWSPSILTAKARWDGVSTCTTTQGSFTMTNLKSKPQQITLTGKGLKPVTGTIPAKNRAVACITKGYSGTVHVTLKDGKKLTVHF